MKRKIVAIIVTAVCLSTLLIPNVSINADNNRPLEGLSYEIPTSPYSNQISPYSVSMPNKSNVYTNNSSQTVSGTASISTLYTNKCFKGVTSIGFLISNYRKDKDLSLNLRQYNTIGNSSVSTKSIPRNGVGASSFTGLSTDKYYFIGFSAPSDFSGTVTGNTK